MFHQFTVIKVSAANHCHDAFSWHRACQCLNPCDGQGRLCHNLSICKLCPNQLRQQEQSDTDKKNAMCVETEKSSDNVCEEYTSVSTQVLEVTYLLTSPQGHRCKTHQQPSNCPCRELSNSQSHPELWKSLKCFRCCEAAEEAPFKFVWPLLEPFENDHTNIHK